MSYHSVIQEAAVLTLTTAASDSILAIIQERVEQKMIHGFEPEHDEQHSDGELAQAALAILAADCNAYQDTVGEAFMVWPPGWDSAILDHILAEKPYLKRLAVAGALIVAEMDRVLMLVDGELAKGPE